MTDVQAAMGLCQLMKLDKQIEARRKYIQIYQERLGKIPEIVTPPGETHHRHSWHLYIIQLKTDELKISRDDFVESMRDANIECSVHYIPLHLFPYYQKRYGYREGDFPCAEAAFERVVSLPLHLDLTVQDIHTVVDTIGKILK